MKRIAVFAVVLLALYGASARPVESARARMVAQMFLDRIGYPEVVELNDVSSQTPYTGFYTFTFNQGRGFVLIAGDDCVMPVLGYSTESAVRFENMPSNLKKWLDDYEAQIRYCRDHSIMPTPAIAAQWNGQWESNNNAKSVGAMVITKWDQGAPYNSLCPSAGGDSPHAYTGCTATAMAQILRYWNHPATGYGSHSYKCKGYDTLSADFGAAIYEWDSMPAKLTSTSREGKVKAVATLMYHCGVSVDMGYSTSGSGAFTLGYGRDTLRCTEYALVENFKYRNTLRALFADDFADDEWIAILKHEFDNGRPVLYTGYDREAGHAFVADGYDDKDYVHINWGWSGAYDGYFQMGHLNPGEGSSSSPGASSSGSYNRQCAALVGIEPNPEFGKGCTVTGTSADPTMGSVTGSGNFEFGQRATLKATAKEGYRFVRWSDGNHNNPRITVATGYDRSVSAVFEALHPDTMHYCTSNLWFGDMGQKEGDKYWGIRYPAQVIESGYGLNAVLFYATKSANFDVEVFEGSVDEAHKLYSHEVFVNTLQTNAWTIHEFDSTIHFTGDQPVWIRLHSKGVAKVAVYTASSGNADSRLWGESLDADTMSNQSWMIRGVFQHPDSANVEVRCAGNGEVYLLPEKKNISNTWFATEKHSTLQIGVGSKQGAQLLHLFVNDTDYLDSLVYADYEGEDTGIIQFKVEGYTVVRAVFDGWNSIDDIDNPFTVSVEDGRIVVSGAESENVQIFDVSGRKIGNSHTRLAPGVYLVKVGTCKARKVTVL